jgi:tRNA(fMet)-specific endonuclease VapC
VGIVLDSTVIIAAERAGKNPRGIIDHITAHLDDQPATLSAITIVELSHGIERANSPARRASRERFLTELLDQFTVEPVTIAIASLAGRIDGRMRAQGATIALGDLLIGATALDLGYAVVTHNLRHFAMIPNLSVRQL